MCMKVFYFHDVTNSKNNLLYHSTFSGMKIFTLYKNVTIFIYKQISFIYNIDTKPQRKRI